MDDFLVHSETIAGPATHALVIGVGSYPHLVSGTGPLYGGHGGMGQLTSPPLSAIRFAEWLTKEFDNPARPLASLALLVSGDGPTSFTHPLAGGDHSVERATMDRVEKAIKQWKLRGDSDPGHLMLLYFCGHGIANGADLALLMEDFGHEPDSALDAALDFRRFHLGMERCQARHQCFFIDACRQGDRNIVAAAGYAGRPVLTPTTQRDPNLPFRQKPVFYSTLAGTQAYSMPGEVSSFTSALLRACRGGGADDTQGDWWVDTSQLQRSIQFLLEQLRKRGFLPDQINTADELTTFPLHRLIDPRVPVVVGCEPDSFNPQATLEYRSDSSGSASRRPEKLDWELELELGQYEFKASFAGDQHRTVVIQRSVRPPYRLVRLEVQI